MKVKTALGPGSQRLPREPLSTRAYADLKHDIVGCRLRPGTPINEGDLAARYGMSKTPVREALNRLVQEGFVQVLPRRGTLVRSIEVQDVQNTFLLRMLLEPEAASLAATRATADQLKELRDFTARSQEMSGRASLGERLAQHRSFHEAVSDASGIPELFSMIRILHAKVEWFYNYARVRVPAEESTSERRKALVDAIVDGDPDRARALVTENIKVSRQFLIDALLREPRLALVERTA